jgi:hypothetical protein
VLPQCCNHHIIMPESNKAARARKLKANRAAGIGDENGRMPARVKAAAQLAKCAECQQEFKITKTNTELRQHAENKHGKALEACFPGADKISAELANAKAAAAGGGTKGGGGGSAGEKKKKKPTGADLDDLLSDGLASASIGKKKGGKK